jgi:hypothetical protein
MFTENDLQVICYLETQGSLTVLKDRIAKRLAIIVENPGADSYGLF